MDHKHENELNHIDVMDCLLAAAANISSECFYCGKNYREHIDFEHAFQGIFDGKDKIACCKKCLKDRFE